jgi:6-phosphogluconolactonase
MSKETSRREFLTLSAATLAASRLGGFQGSERGLFAYVGRRTRGGFGGGPAAGAPGGGAAGAGAGGAARGAAPAGGPGGGGGGGRGAAVPTGGGVTVFRVNMSDGSLTKVSETGPEVDDLNCDGMCASDDGRFIYAVNQTKDFGGKLGTGGGVAAFAINREDGSLKHLNTLPSMGSNPVGVVIDKTNARVLVANHGAVQYIPVIVKRNGVPVVETLTDEATVAMYPVKPDGSLEAACDVSVFARDGNPRGVWNAPAAHRVVFDRTQRWAIASDNGYDHLYVYPFNPGSRKLEGKSYPTAPGKAPRHIAVHPRAPYIFFTNEREASVSSYSFDSNTGEPRHVQTIATIPAGYSGPNVSPSSINLHPNGKFLYSQNRGDDSLAMFSVDEASGRLTMLGTVKCGGRGPREMGIEPSGKYLFECNQQSGDVTTFVIDASTGKLTEGPKVALPQAGVISFALI